MSTEFTFIECSSQTAFEKNDENNKYITRVDGGIVIPENSRLTVENAFVNVLGADSDVIEMTGRKIGEFLYYSEGKGDYSEVYDNKVTIQLEYYKNGDMDYYFPVNYPYWNYHGDFPTMAIGKDNYSFELCPRGMQKIQFDAVAKTWFLAGETQTGVTSSTNYSVYGYNYPHDNRRYTICKRSPTTIYDNTSAHNGVIRDGLLYARDISYYHYNVYNKPLEIVVTEGQNTASSIAEQITQQLTKVTDPEIFEMTCWQDEPALETDLWVGNDIINGSLTMSNPTFDLIQCASRRSFWKGAVYKFWDGATLNTDQEAFIYQDNFEYIGIANPDVFITGRNSDSLNIGLYTPEKFADKGFVHYITSTVTAVHNQSEYLLETSIPYDEGILKSYHNLFEYQVADPDLFDNLQTVSELGFSPDDTVFLHMDVSDYNTVSDNAYYQHPFGSDKRDTTTNYNPNMTNCVYLKYQKDFKDIFGENLAYGVFERRYISPTLSYCNIRAKITTVGAPAVNDFFIFPLSNLSAEPQANGLPPAPLQVRRIGWDRHFSANGNQSIMLYNGLAKDSNLEVNLPGKETAANTFDNYAPQYVNQNSYLNTVDGKEYFYDTGINKIYIGSDNCQLGFDLNESRFIFSNFHTPRNEANNDLSGFDSFTMKNIGTLADGKETIYYQSAVTTQRGQIEFPLNANPNANTAIYQISPPTITEQNKSIYGLSHWAGFNGDGLKTNTIFDSMTGVFIGSFGIDESTFKGSLWDILGFTLEQTKSYMAGTRQFANDHFILNRNARKLNQGVNIIDSIKYPFTTNADVQANEIRTWRTNPFGLSYFDTLIPPTNSQVTYGKYAGAGFPHTITYPVDDNVKKYEVTQNQTSTQMFAEKLASKTLTPFYQIRSDILQDQFQYFGGDLQSSGRLPCVSMVNKSEPGADYFSQTSTGVEYIIKKRLVINNIVTEIYDNMGRLAKNISPYSSIVYRIEKLYTPPAQSIPFSTIQEMELAEMEKDKKNKK